MNNKLFVRGKKGLKKPIKNYSNQFTFFFFDVKPIKKLKAIKEKKRIESIYLTNFLPPLQHVKLNMFVEFLYFTM